MAFWWRGWSLTIGLSLCYAGATDHGWRQCALWCWCGLRGRGEDFSSDHLAERERERETERLCCQLKSKSQFSELCGPDLISCLQSRHRKEKGCISCLRYFLCYMKWCRGMQKVGKLWRLIGDHHEANKHHNAIWCQLQTMRKYYFTDINTVG